MDQVFGLDSRWVTVGMLVVVLFAAEVGYRFGVRHASSADEQLRQQHGAVQAAVLALLGLILALSFSMAQDRYEARRVAVVEEANAIATAWSRADALPEAGRAETKRLLRAYVDARLAFYDAGEDEAALAAAVATSEELQRAMWTRAMAEALAAPDSVPVSLLLEALNTLVDDHEVRVAALRAHVPLEVIALLVVLGAAGLASVGYTYGLVRRRAFHAVALLALLVAATLHVVLDLDRPRGGLIGVSQWSIRALRDTIEAGAPPDR